MRSLLRRYREPVFVAFLLALPFAIFAAKARKPMSHNLFDRAVLAVTAPVEKAIVMAVNGMQDAWHGYVALRGVREENLRLRRDVLHDHNEASALIEVKAENERLKRLLEYADRQSPTRYGSFDLRSTRRPLPCRICPRIPTRSHQFKTEE